MGVVFLVADPTFFTFDTDNVGINFATLAALTSLPRNKLLKKERVISICIEPYFMLLRKQTIGMSNELSE